MKVILTNEWHDILRFDLGDDIIAGILQYAKDSGISAAWLSAIGSVKNTQLGFYDLIKKVYVNKTFQGPMELIEASGTLGVLDGKPVLHFHGVFSDESFQTIGGHIQSMIANATVEIFIHTIIGTIERKRDPKTGLNLFHS